MSTLLAFDSATERVAIGLAVGARAWTHDDVGGARASTVMLPAILALLDEAGVKMRDLDAVACGRGPGAFTGLRSACALAQGLAFGAGKPVLLLDTLQAIAEDARVGTTELRIWSVLDARMNEIYAAQYRFSADRWQVLDEPRLISPIALVALWQAAAPAVVAGNALSAFAAELGPALDRAGALRLPDAQPHPRALLTLAQAGWQRGEAVDAALALPLYLRDKVAQTSAERAALRTV